MNLCKIWIEQCGAAEAIEDEFGTQKARGGHSHLPYRSAQRMASHTQNAATAWRTMQISPRATAPLPRANASQAA
jgi:hypothetical protein